MKKILFILLAVIMLVGCSQKPSLSGAHEGILTAAVGWGSEEGPYRTIYVDFENRMIVTDNSQVREDVPEKVLEKISALFDSYIPVIQKKEDAYWPQTEEYPAMLQLFGVEVTYGDGTVYSQDGSLAYPDGWDLFTQKLQIISAEP